MNVELQVIGSALRAVAEEMGAVLIRSSFSANIKERHDCSTAIFDDDGRMIAQAEHIPVHLGAMPDAVDAVRALDPAPDEIYVLNDPYTGGTHLPDVTLVSRTALGFAVSRAHHADVGGMEPASLPAFSRELLQEGLVLPPVRLTDEVWRLFLANTRNPTERRGDLLAQVSAHALAKRRIDELCSRRGRERVAAAMDELYAYSERVVRASIARLPDGRRTAEDVVEETFWQAWRKASSYEPSRGAVSTWLLTIGRRRALDRLRAKSRRKEESTQSGVLADIASPASDPLQMVESSERRSNVLTALRELPAEQREVLELGYFQGLSQSEIADTTGQPLGTVKTRMRLAMQKLREPLSMYREGAQ